MRGRSIQPRPADRIGKAIGKCRLSEHLLVGRCQYRGRSWDGGSKVSRGSGFTAAKVQEVAVAKTRSDGIIQAFAKEQVIPRPAKELVLTRPRLVRIGAEITVDAIHGRIVVRTIDTVAV